jgi:hypothetical protein
MDNPFDKGRTVSQLELAARACLEVSKRTTNIWQALAAHNCCIAITRLPGWKPYDDLEEENHESVQSSST